MSARPAKPTRPDPEPLPEGVTRIGAPLAALMADRMALRFDEIATSLGVSRRTLERERSAGRFPRPDLTIGRMPLWRPETVRAWLEGGAR